jgi:hypothetical protein
MDVVAQFKQLQLAKRRLDQSIAENAFDQRIREIQTNSALMTNPALVPVQGGKYAGAVSSPSGIPASLEETQKVIAARPLSNAPADTSAFPDWVGQTRQAVEGSPLSNIRMAPDMQTSMQLPARPQSTFSGLGGRQFMALTPQEQVDQGNRLQAQTITADTLARAGAGEQVRQKFGHPPPPEIAHLYPPGYLLTDAEMAHDVPMLIQGMRADKKARDDIERDRLRQERQEAATAGENALNRTNAVKVAQIRASQRGGERGMTPGQGAVQSRFDQRELDRAIADTATWQDQEQVQHQTRLALGEALSTPVGQDFVDPQDNQQHTMNALRQAQLKRRLAAATSQVAALQEKQRKTRQRFGLGEYGPGGTGQVAAPVGQVVETPAVIPGQKPVYSWPSGAEAAGEQPQGRIRVRSNADGRTGMIDAKDFDPAIMTRL